MMKVILSSILALLYANVWAASRIGPFGPITPSDREFSGTVAATNIISSGTITINSPSSASCLVVGSTFTVNCATGLTSVKDLTASGTISAKHFVASNTITDLGSLSVTGAGGITSTYGVSAATGTFGGASIPISAYEPLRVGNAVGASGIGIYSLSATQAFLNLYDATALKWGIIKQASPYSLDFNNGNSTKILSLSQNGNVAVTYDISAASATIGGGVCPSTASVCLNALPLAANAGAYFGGPLLLNGASNGNAYDVALAAGSGNGIVIFNGKDGTATNANRVVISQTSTTSGKIAVLNNTSSKAKIVMDATAGGQSYIDTGGYFGVGTSTNTTGANGLTVGGGGIDSQGRVGLFSLTAAQLEAVTPTAAGQIYYCSDCSNAVHVVVSTGSAVCQFDAFTGGTAWH